MTTRNVRRFVVDTLALVVLLAAGVAFLLLWVGVGSGIVSL